MALASPAQRQKSEEEFEKRLEEGLKKFQPKPIPSSPPTPLGFKLRHTLSGHKQAINQIAWSPDGRTLASGPILKNEGIHLWDVEAGKLIQTLKSGGSVLSLAWSPDRQLLASGLAEDSIEIWDIKMRKLYRKFEGNINDVFIVTWSPDGNVLASGGTNNNIQLWNVKTGKLHQLLEGHKKAIMGLAWSPDSQKLASASRDGTIKIWNWKNGKCLKTLKDHKGQVFCVSWSPDGHTIVSGGQDNIIRFWSLAKGQPLPSLEGHSSAVVSVVYSPDGRFLASKSMNEPGTIRLWRCDTWESIAILDEQTSNQAMLGIDFHPTAPVLATLGGQDKIIHIWDLDYDILLGTAPAAKPVHYTTAKIALVGDSGVGKTGLGWRLAHGEYKEHSSTHGQQFWTIEELKTKRDDGTECEAILWDLAGQPDYRLIHSLFLDDVDLALLLFDPTNREKPLGSVEFWLKQLSGKQSKTCPAILVGARVDRGSSTLTEQELEAYCKHHGIAGGYVATSAKNGHGLSEVMRQIIAQINWADRPATITTSTFKRVKEYVLSLKEDSATLPGALVSAENLRQHLQATDSNWEFADHEMMTAVRHLENHGYVTILKRSSGEEAVLLFPDLLVNLASSIVLEARRNPSGLGALEEEALLRGKYSLPELSKLSTEEQEILLDAATVLFLERNLCFRETFNDRTFLVFPSLINEKRPRIEDIQIVEDVSYKVSGAVENIYASLVVLLGYTNSFIRTHQWQNQAQYELGANEVCGFRQTNEHQGEIELTLYYSAQTPAEARLLFQGMFERFLKRHEATITRYPPVICAKCGERQERMAVMGQYERKRNFLFCVNCGKKISLPKTDQLIALPRENQAKVAEEQTIVALRTAFEAALVWVKGILRERSEKAEVKEVRPSCFISYAWGVAEHEKWVIELAKDLRNAEIEVILDRWHNPPGQSISKFTDKISASDFVVAVCTPKYLEKYKTMQADPIVDSEIRLINTRLRKREDERIKVLPLLLDGDQITSFPPLFEDSVFVDFRVAEHYFVKLFDLILTLFKIPFDHPRLDELRDSMRLRVGRG